MQKVAHKDGLESEKERKEYEKKKQPIAQSQVSNNVKSSKQISNLFIQALSDFTWFSVLFEYDLLANLKGQTLNPPNRKIKSRCTFQALRNKIANNSGGRDSIRYCEILYNNDYRNFRSSLIKCDCMQQYLTDSDNSSTTSNSANNKSLRNRAAVKKNCKDNITCLFGLGEKRLVGVYEMAVDENKKTELSDYAYGDDETEMRIVGKTTVDTEEKHSKTLKKMRESFEEKMGPDPGVDLRDSSVQKRCGLKNYGATCYVNTLLQIWFHLDEFRDAIYRWGRNWESYRPGAARESVSFEIEKVFAYLQFSSRWFYSPDGLMSFLSLSKGEQQDAQEFSKLLMQSLAQETLDIVLDNNTACTLLLKHSLEKTFFGSYCYSTRCKKCNSVSRRYADFGELELALTASFEDPQEEMNKGSQRKTPRKKKRKNAQSVRVIDCIKQFLIEENLDGDNQYMCSTCERKQDAVRKIELKRLPKVLTLQLLRFVYSCNQHGEFEKVKDSKNVEFSEELDLSPFLSKEDMGAQNANGCRYVLKAVIMHNGSSAYSGHYTAMIRTAEGAHSENTTPKYAWEKFDDEIVKGMKSKDLSQEENSEEESIDDNNNDVNERSRVGKKRRFAEQSGTNGTNTYGLSHKSKNAYTLVYVQLGNDSLPSRGEDDARPSQCLMKEVEEDNYTLESKSEEYKVGLQIEVDNHKTEAVKKFSLYKALAVSKPAEPLLEEYEHGIMEFISTSWLRKWLSDSTFNQSVDNSHLLCSHSKLSLMKMSNAKLVNSCSLEGMKRMDNRTGDVNALFSGNKASHYGAASEIFFSLGGHLRLFFDARESSDIWQGLLKQSPLLGLEEGACFTKVFEKYADYSLCVQCVFSEFCYPFVREMLESDQNNVRELLGERKPIENAIPKAGSGCQENIVSSKNLTTFLDFKMKPDSLCGVNWTDLPSASGESADKSQQQLTLHAVVKRSNMLKTLLTSDLFCSHGGLITSEVETEYVSDEIVEILSAYMPLVTGFEKAKIFASSSDKVCDICVKEDDEKKLRSEKLLADAEPKRKALLKIARSVNTGVQSKRWNEWHSKGLGLIASETSENYGRKRNDTPMFYVLSRPFFFSLKAYLNNPAANPEPPSSSMIDGLLCDKHHLLEEDFLFDTLSRCKQKRSEDEDVADCNVDGYDPAQAQSQLKTFGEEFALVQKNEYDAISEFYDCGQPIQLFGRSFGGSVTRSGRKGTGARTVPKQCASCVLEVKAKRRKHFHGESVIIEKIVSQVCPTTSMRINDVNVTTTRKLSSQTPTSRSRKKREDFHRVLSSSTDSLMDLRLAITDHFKVMPADQKLLFNETLLDRESDKKCLYELDIAANSKLFLYVDETHLSSNSYSEAMVQSTEGLAQKKEDGFKGTNLVSR